MPCQTIGAGATTLANGVTTVDCQKQVRSWRLLRSLIKLLIPSCNRTFIEEPETKAKKPLQNYYYHHHQPNKPTSFTSSTITTGTIFGFRRGKVSLCIQTDSKSTNPILLLEFALPTAVLAREMQGGILRIALECSAGSGSDNSSTSLFSMPVWTMYCNGRKAGYAVKRRPSKVDMEALKLMNSVVVDIKKNKTLILSVVGGRQASHRAPHINVTNHMELDYDYDGARHYPARGSSHVCWLASSTLDGNFILYGQRFLYVHNSADFIFSGQTAV
eukprot:XP_015583481.1 protein MIZU-KUSSEI 1 [Ricinus communis]